MTTEVFASFEAEVWERLSRIDVSDHVEQIEATAKRRAINYLPWHKAWTLVKRAFPGTSYTHRPDLHHPDGTVEVEVDVVIMKAGPDKAFSNARLAVMDSWFNPISNPHARDINDTRQRALVKALAFAGLGLNLWSDSVIPVGRLNDPIDLDQMEAIEKLIEETESNRERFLEWVGVEEIGMIPLERYPSAHRLLSSKKERIEAMKKAEAMKKKAKSK